MFHNATFLLTDLLILHGLLRDMMTNPTEKLIQSESQLGGELMMVVVGKLPSPTFQRNDNNLH